MDGVQFLKSSHYLSFSKGNLSSAGRRKNPNNAKPVPLRSQSCGNNTDLPDPWLVTGSNAVFPSCSHSSTGGLGGCRPAMGPQSPLCPARAQPVSRLMADTLRLFPSRTYTPTPVPELPFLRCLVLNHSFGFRRVLANIMRRIQGACGK